jgi:hypothetical protein
VTENDIATHMLASTARSEPVAHQFEFPTATESFRRALRAKARTQQIQIEPRCSTTLLVIALNDAEFWHEPLTTIRNTRLLAG